MAKSYSKSTKSTEGRAPKKETIDFILKYSKALQVMKINNLKVNIMLN